MGTRGNFYIYLIVGGKKILVYTYYTHYDAFERIPDVIAFYKSLMATSGYTVADVICQMTKSYNNDLDGPSTDAECVYHANLECDLSLSDLDDLDPSQFEYVTPLFSSYGRQVTAAVGDCYQIIDQESKLFTVINQAKVKLQPPYIHKLDDLNLLVARLATEFGIDPYLMDTSDSRILELFQALPQHFS